MLEKSRLAFVALCAALGASVPARAQAPVSGPRHLAPTAPAGAPATGPVRIAGGRIAGAILPDSVRIFRGIPFAAPPLGDLRWKPPQPARPWDGVRDATRFGPQCMQLPVFGDMVFRSDGMSEDCLYLNVWAPPTAATGRRLPVLLYIYGGGFVGGDGSELRYDGESLARRGIVVVTTNYRLGVFGFLALPELTRESPHHASGNYGLLDQVAALQWVRRNIAAFGGDPTRITIAGESAGSIAVCALMASPLSRGLIAGAIGESGGMIHPTAAPVPPDSAQRRGEAFAERAGASSLSALRALPAESLLKASRRAYFPAVVDGWFLPQSPAEIFAAGRQAHVPLLLGWNSQEQEWRSLLGLRTPTPQNWTAVIDSLYGADSAEALQLFPGATQEQVMESGTLLAGARWIAYSTWKWAELQGRTGGRPVYRYVFVHPRPATRGPTPIPPTAGAVVPESTLRAARRTVPVANAAPAGAVHSAEIEYALGNLATNEVFAWTPQDDSVSAAMEGYFAAFVKTGDPNGLGLPAWPAAYSGGEVKVMILDAQPHAERAPHEDAFRFLDRRYRSSTRAP